MIIVRVALDVQPQQGEALVEALRAQAPHVRRMEGCAWFEVYTDAATPNRVLLYEEWRDATCFDAYKRSAPFRALNETVRPMLAGPPDSAYYSGEPLPVA